MPNRTGHMRKINGEGRACLQSTAYEALISPALSRRLIRSDLYNEVAKIECSSSNIMRPCGPYSDLTTTLASQRARHIGYIGRKFLRSNNIAKYQRLHLHLPKAHLR